MEVILVPTRLRISACALLLCIPIVALEVVIATQAPWWKLPYRGIGYWALIFTLICIPLSMWLATAKKWAYPLTLVLAGIWVLVSLWLVIRTRYPSLGFFTFCLLAFLSAELMWLKYELQRSFINPRVRWFQGLPKPIPGLRCQLASGEKAVELRVGRIDEDGVFLFSQGEVEKSSVTLLSLLDRKKLEMTFNFRGRQIACSGVPTSFAWEGAGAGIKFIGLSADLKKEIGDFLEVLRGEGYV